MKIQFNTDKNIQGTEALEQHVAEKITSGLKHYSNRITRVEVHLSDQNANKGGVDDILCKIEARVENLKPILVTSSSDSKEKALDASISKLKTSLGTVVGKIRNK